MDVRLTDDVATFASLAEPVLRAERYTANVIAVQVHGVLSGRRPLADGSSWILVEDGGSVVGAAMHTPPYNLFLPRLGPGIAETVADALIDRRVSVPGVSGEAPTVGRFLARWEARGGPPASLRTSMRMYVLGRLQPPAGVAGHGRRAGAADAGLVGEWLVAFHDEAMPGAPREDFAASSPQRIAHGNLWMWEVDGEPVSLAGVSPPAAGVARVGPVFTPPVHRRRGYGAAVTALASQAGIDEGSEDVVLYTDLANPTSNAVYRSIGYEPHHDSGDWRFDG
jgi:uncharacterized protein